MGMLAQMGLGDEFLHHHIDHGAGGEGQHPGHHARHAARRQHGEQAEHRLHHTGQRAADESLAPAHALPPQGQADGRALGEVLQPHADGQRHRTGQSRRAAVPGSHREGQAHGHALGDVVQRHRQHHHCGALQVGGQALRLIAADVQVGQQAVQQHQKDAAQHKAASGGQQRALALLLGHLHGGDEQRPHRRGDHHPGGKAQKGPLQPGAHVLFKQKHGARPQHGGKAGGSGAQHSKIQFTRKHAFLLFRAASAALFSAAPRRKRSAGQRCFHYTLPPRAFQLDLPPKSRYNM